MKSIWIFLLRKQAFTYMMISALVLAGAVSLIAIPKESSPEVIIPIGIVSTVIPGASSPDVEKLVTDKIEEEVANIDNVDKVTSSSREGVSVVTVQFLGKADVDKSITLLKEAVDKAKTSLPTEAKEPVVTKVNFSDQPIIIASVSTDAPDAARTSLAKEVEAELKKVPGVSKVVVSGVRKKEVQVIVKKEKLLQYGISLSQVVGAINQANASLPVGKITVSNIDYPILLEGSLEDASEVPNIPLEAPNGSLVYIRDVADIRDGLTNTLSQSRVSVDGAPSSPAMSFSVFKKSGEDVTTVSDAVKTRLEELKGSTLSGSEIIVSFDSGKTVKKDLRELSRTGLETIALVMLVLFLTIGWRESIVAGLSIPLSFVIAFIGLYLSGNTINFLSLFALILAIGILVDSGIVVAEAIHTRTKSSGSVKDAAIATIHEYAWPLIAGTMTTVAVFLPLFFLSGIVGQFVKSIPFTLVFVLIASIFVALGMVPLLAILLSSKEHKESAFSKKQDEYFTRVQTWYKRVLGLLLKEKHLQKKFFLSLAGGFVFVILLTAFGFVKVEIFPQDNQDFVIVSVEKKEGTPLGLTDLSLREVEDVLYEKDYIQSFVSTAGSGSALLDNGGGSGSKLANITVILADNRTITSTEVVTQLQKDLEGITSAVVTVSQGNNGPPGGKPLQVKLTGTDLQDLSTAATLVEQEMKSATGTKDVVSSNKDDGTSLQVTIDRAKAAQAGISPLVVAQTLRTAVSGSVASTIKKGEDDIDIVVKVALNSAYVQPEDTTVTTLDALKDISIPTRTGSVLLGSVITSVPVLGRSSIDHENRKRIITISGDVADGYNAYEFTGDITSKVEKLTLPSGVTVKYGGENEDAANTFRDMLIALIAGMLGMLAILVLEFNSVRYSLYLLAAIPLSLIGVLGGLATTGKALSFSAMLGVIALAGVIINHAIILLDSILHRLDDVEKSKNLSLFDAIIESSAIRLRPIVLTTVTTVVGMIPLAGVSALWGPLAISIMFGLSFAMLLTLALIPLLFYMFPGKRYAHLKVK